MAKKSLCRLSLESQTDCIMLSFSAKVVPQSKRYLLLMALTGLITLSACGQPEVIPPSVEPVLSNYLNVLHSGNLKQAERLYFMPLHWRSKEKIFKLFKKEHELIKQNKLSIRFISVKQNGRWALSMLEHSQAGETLINQLWFFYYDGRWQVISPVIFKTGPVRAMMDLYREHNELRLWYKKELYKQERYKNEQSNYNISLEAEINRGSDNK